jgi:hypothetical protein
MKKALLSILLATAFATPAIFAQQGSGNPPDPSRFVARRVQHLTTLLDLTPGQAQTATNAFTTAATANAPLGKQLRAAHQTLESDIQGGSGNVQTDSTTISNLEAQVRANDAAAEKTFFASLTTDQQTKYKSLGHGGGGGFGRGGFGGPGPGGPH